LAGPWCVKCGGEKKWNRGEEHHKRKLFWESAWTWQPGRTGRPNKIKGKVEKKEKDLDETATLPEFFSGRVKKVKDDSEV